MFLCKNKIAVCLIYLKYTPDSVFFIKKNYFKHFYSENVLFNMLGSVFNIYTIFCSTCAENSGTTRKQENEQGWPNLDLIQPYLLLKY